MKENKNLGRILKGFVAAIAVAVVAVPKTTYAMDVITLPLQLIYDKQAFEMTQAQTDAMNGGDMHVPMVIRILMLLPLAILSDDGHAVQINEKYLLESGYSTSEIQDYKTDIQKIQAATKNVVFQNREELNHKLDSLNLHPITLDLMQMQ